MKFYISAQTAAKEDVMEIYRKLRKLGHEISYDWTKRTDLERPYDQDLEIAESHVSEIIWSIRDSDVFVMLSDKKGIDMYGELASAISFKTVYKKPEIFVLGNNTGKSIFTFHPRVNHRKTIEDVLEEVDKN